MPTEVSNKIYLYRRVVQAKQYIDENFADATNADDIADKACFSKFHFIRLFKSIYSKTPHQYLIHVRIEKAKTLLQQDITVSEVCFLVGAENNAAFSTVFKRITSFSPAAYQQIQLKRIKSISQTPLKYIPVCFAWKNSWEKE